MKIKFKEALEDLYGFPKPELVQPKVSDELPIQPFSSDRMFDRLERTKIGDLPIKRSFIDEVQWGDKVGAIRARLTPNKGVIIERRTSDLQGQSLWIVKKTFKIKTEEFVGHEEIVADEVAQHVKHIAHEPIDSAQRSYSGLFGLVRRITEKLQTRVNPSFSFQEVKKINDNNYNILLSVAGYGQGKLVSRLKPGPSSGGIIDLSYNPETGMVKGILTTIEVEESGAWEIDVPYFMGSFAPSQPPEEIVTSMIAGLKFI